MLATWSLAGAVPGAEAATVGFVAPEQVGALPAVTYRAAPGEANRLVVSAAPDGRTWTFRDAGAPVQPGSGCAVGADGAIACTAPSTGPGPLTSYVVIDLGDGSDVGDVSASRFGGAFDLDAGPGDDVVRVRSGYISASMGPGDDTARADAGGGLGVRGGPGADAFDAGPRARLQVMYGDSATAVHVTTDGRANDGAPGEGDNVSPYAGMINGSGHDDVLDARAARTPVSIYGENGDDRAFASPRGGLLEGGFGDDVLRGGRGPDHLYGDQGDDELIGGPGDDRMSGERGHDLLVGGPGRDTFIIDEDGRDTVHARDRTQDRVICDWLPHSLRVDRADRLERCAFPVAVSAQPPVTPHRRLRLTLRCPWLAPGGCRGTLVVFDSRPHPLGRVRFALAAGAGRRLAVRLSRLPRELVVAAAVVDRRARPPASQRTTVWTLDLSPP
jgi:hypothetical protein